MDISSSIRSILTTNTLHLHEEGTNLLDSGVHLLVDKVASLCMYMNPGTWLRTDLNLPYGLIFEVSTLPVCHTTKILLLVL